MKKCIMVMVCLFALLCSASAYAASLDADIGVVQEGTNIKGSVSIEGVTYPVAVTVTVKDEKGGLNYIDIIMTNENGLADFEYNNLGKSGDYDFCFHAAALNLEKTVTLKDFKGYDYWDGYLQRVSTAARNNNFSEMKSLIVTEVDELLYLDLIGSGYDALEDKDAVFKAMILNCTEYTSPTQLIKEFYAATKLCGYNLNKSADALKQIYLQEASLNLFDLYTSIPGDDSGKTVLDCLPVEVTDKVYEQIVDEEGFEKASDLTTAFVLHTLTGTIKNAGHYGTVKTVLKAYSNAGLISLNIKSNDFDAVCKVLMHKSFQTIKAVETFANEAVKLPEPGNNSGGGGGGRGGAIVVSVPAEKTEPINTPKAESEYQSGEMYFSDMEDSKWALDAVNLLYKYGVVSGSGENKFEPNRAVTRAEMAKMAVDTARMVKVTYGPAFVDVCENDWFYEYVMTACNEGIFVGREENKFASRELITRQEAAVVIYRMVKDKLTDNAGAEVVFDDDESISDWAREAVYTLRNNSIMKGRSATEFCPGELLTRAEAAILFSKIIKHFI